MEHLHPAHRGRGRLPHPQVRPRHRPIWHHKETRIKAHILICFLAYVLWKTLQQWQSRAGLGDSPRTVLTEFSRIHAADIVLPLADGFAARADVCAAWCAPSPVRRSSWSVSGSPFRSDCACHKPSKCSADFGP